MTEALAINLESPCWLFQGWKHQGYGRLRRDGKTWYAHRYMWTVMRGSVPEGFELDHLCRNKLCVNPQHLEVVTHKVNILRGESPSAKHAVKTHCPKGHPYDEANTRLYCGSRSCRQCRLDSDVTRREEINRLRRVKYHRLHPEAPDHAVRKYVPRGRK